MKVGDRVRLSEYGITVWDRHNTKYKTGIIIRLPNKNSPYIDVEFGNGERLPLKLSEIILVNGLTIIKRRHNLFG